MKKQQTSDPGPGGWSSRYWIVAVTTLPAILLAGCGPTREQMLAYEIVLAVTGGFLGIGLWVAGLGIRRKCLRQGTAPGFLRAACLSMLLAVGTFVVLALPGFVFGQFGWADLPSYDSIVRFPICFAFTQPRDYPGLGLGLFFYCYAMLGLFAGSLEKLDRPGWIAAGYVLTVLTIWLHWLLGLRGVRRGWLFAVILCLCSAGIAVLAYVVPAAFRMTH